VTDVVVVKPDLPPDDGGGVPGDVVVQPTDPKPEPGGGSEAGTPPTDEVVIHPDLPPGDDEVIYYTMGPAAPTAERDDHPAGAGPVATLWAGDRVWRDADGDGQQDAAEAGIAGLTVQLYEGGTLVGTATTSATGGYLFTPANVHNGTPADKSDDGLHAHTAYQIRIALDQPALAGTRLAPANAGDDAGDSDASAAGGSAVIAFTTGDTWAVHSYDAGFAPTAEVGDKVWNDANNNGRWDTGEAGLGGVTVRLLDAAGTTAVATTTTAADGSYHFTGLLPGRYVVEVAAANFAAGGALAGYMSSTGKAGSTTGPYEGTAPAPADGQDAGTTANGVVRSAPVAAAAETAASVDFGFVKTGGGIAGKVFRDRNGDGQIDLLNAEERTGLAGVVIRASGPGGTFYATTDAAGAYAFPNLPAGSYAVSQMKQPVGFASTTPNTVLVPVAAAVVTQNFGEQARADLKVTQTVSRSWVSLGNEVIVTIKVKNQGAAAAADVKVQTRCGADLKMVRTAANGRGTYDTATGVWSVGTLAAGETATCTMRVKVKGYAALGVSARGQTSSKEDVVTNNKAVSKLKGTPSARPLWMTGR
ncbi:MAG TPA: SdrD B-like domain-containing protein, partial [Gemmataceae bacterium]|nr:SdrD B-like domain-containing protein [Gemmataceae bacterium]